MQLRLMQYHCSSMGRSQAASLYPSSSGLEAAGRPLSQQIFQLRLEAQSRSSARAVGRLDPLRQDNHSPADLWRSDIRRGHSGATLRYSLTTR